MLIEQMENRKSYFGTKQTKSVAMRLQMLEKLRRTIIKYEDEISNALKQDLNKNEFDSYMTEIGMVLTEITFISKQLKGWAKPKKVKDSLATFGASGYIYPEPYGQVLIISPWNYPFLLALGPLVGAISAGNVVCVKPSEFAVATGKIVEKIITEVFPKNYVTVTQGDVEVTTELLKQKWDYIFFTGSSTVGKIVMRAASENLTPVTLELGGKSPCIVCKDANLDIAAKRIVWGKYVNAGQTCVAPDYILVDEEVKAELLIKLEEQIHLLHGVDSLEKKTFTKIINERHFQRLRSFLTPENIVIGGKFNEDACMIEPTVLTNITHDLPVMKEEIFGPILPVLTFKQYREVINVVNAKEKPLALYLFTENKRIEEELLDSIPFGGGCVNDTVYHLSSPYLPFGGVGNSGMGSYHGKSTFDTFTHYKSVLKQTTKFDLPFRYGKGANALSIIKKLLR